jgi:hypothetical protein
MNGLEPALVRRLLRRQARVVEPALIEELGATIRKRGPGQARKRIDEISELDWHTQGASSSLPSERSRPFLSREMRRRPSASVYFR